MLATLMACNADAMTEAMATASAGAEELTMALLVEDSTPGVIMMLKEMVVDQF